MITCDQALELISASLDLPLTKEEQQMLDAHLDNCPECRALLADFQKIHQAMAHMTVEPPATLCQGVMDRIQAEQSAEKVVPIRRKPRFWVRWGAAAAIFAVVLLGAGSSGMLDIVFHGSSGSAAPPAVARQADAQSAEENTDAAAAEAKSLPADGQETAAAPSATVAPVDESAVEMPTADSTAQNETGASLTQSVTAAPNTAAQAAPADGSDAEATDVLPTSPTQTPEVDNAGSELVLSAPMSAGASVGLTQEEAEQRLRDWLNAQDNSKTTVSSITAANGVDTSADREEETSQITALGLSADGEHWLFAVTTREGIAHYAVPVDGGAICLLEETD